MYSSDEEDLDDDDIGQGDRHRQAAGGDGKLRTSEGWIWSDDEDTEKRPAQNRVREQGTPAKKKNYTPDSDSNEEDGQVRRNSKGGRKVRDKSTPERTITR